MLPSSEVVKLLEVVKLSSAIQNTNLGEVTTYRKAKVETDQEKNGVLILTPSLSGQEIVTKPSGTP